MNDNSRLGLVIPAEILHIDYASGIRERLLKELDKVMIITFRELVFPNVQQEVVLLLGEKSPAIQNKSMSFIQLDNLDDLNEGVVESKQVRACARFRDRSEVEQILSRH